MKLGITTEGSYTGQAKFSFENGWTAAAQDTGVVLVYPTAMSAENYNADFFIEYEAPDDFSMVEILHGIAQRSRCTFLNTGE